MRGTPDAELCHRCLKPNPAGSHVCGHCAAPLTPHAATDPFGSVFAEGDTIRSAAGGRSLLGVIGVWAVFLPASLFFGLGGVSGVRNATDAVDWLAVVFMAGFFALFGAITVKTTWNYFRQRPAEPHALQAEQRGRRPERTGKRKAKRTGRR